MRQRAILGLLKPSSRSIRPPSPAFQHPIPNALFFSRSYNSSYPYQPYQQQQHYPPLNPLPLGPSRKSRLVKSASWAIFFAILGFTATFHLKKRVYWNQSQIEIDSEGDLWLVQQMIQHMDAQLEIQILKSHPDLEEIWGLATDLELGEKMRSSHHAKDVHHFIYTALRGYRGVFPRVFYDKSRPALIMVVAFGPGLERHVENLHVGALTTMIQESMRILAQLWFPSDASYKLEHLHLNFDAEVAHRELLIITVTPASRIKDLPARVAKDRKTFREEHPDLTESDGAFPKWFDAENWEQKSNTFVCGATTMRRYRGRGNGIQDLTALGRFEVTGKDWPPPPPPQPPQLDMDGNLT